MKCYVDPQACVGCEELCEALNEDDPPDLHMGEAEHSDVTVASADGIEEPRNSQAHSCPGPDT